MELSPPKICECCQTMVSLKFCPNCGQEWSPTGLTLSVLVKEYLAKSIGVDSRFKTTITALFFFPGKMTKDYLNGIRQPYTHPIKFYFFCSFLFLFCLSLVPGMEMLITKSGLSVLTVFEPDFSVTSQLGIPYLDERLSTLTDRGEVLGHAGFFLLMTIPMTALFLKVQFPRLPLVNHLVFSFNFHSLGLLVLLPGAIPWENRGLHDGFNTLLTILALLLLGKMLKEAYSLSRPKNLLMIPLFFCFYVVTFICLALLKVSIFSSPKFLT